MQSTYTKGQAEQYIMQQSGFGRLIVRRAIDRLLAEGVITIQPSIDERARLLSRENVERVIAFLKDQGRSG